MRIDYVGTRFPDACVRVKKGKKWVTKWAEIEVYSSGFEGHMKNIKKTPKVVIWSYVGKMIGKGNPKNSR